jgi:hypothetical protein
MRGDSGGRDAVEGFSPARRNEIIAALKRAYANEPCPRCRHNEFALLDGYVNLAPNPNPGIGLFVGGPAIPAVVTVCTRCGFLSQHALGALGLLPQEVGQDARKAQ